MTFINQIICCAPTDFIGIVPQLLIQTKSLPFGSLSNGKDNNQLDKWLPKYQVWLKETYVGTKDMWLKRMRIDPR